MATPKDTYELLQFNMINAHDTYKLGYTIIMTQLETPPKDDLKNFLGYFEAWVVSVIGHHDTEEEVVFPFLNQKMDFSPEIEQHRVIHDTLHVLLPLIEEAKADPSKFDAEKLKKIMIDFKDPLISHLDEEVEHISAAKMKEAGFAEADILAMLGKMESYAKSHGDPFLLVPYMRSHTAAEYKDTWPPMPWILRKLVIPYVLAKKHSGYWKYSPYAMS
ncbi:hypothetical protein Hypma_013483 [Hypsizygus marmoreus]|uniref:Hemerythrin-like domain-containing protein n=1 Tax=Hypsizygus marmoreus TaxID=39966 RepID=A0A369JDW0_HYPMA|nr:hypothetical protein Hypma_013483 [Hypsizygus marmoreus]